MDVRDVLAALLVFLLVFAALCFLSQLLAAFLRDLWRQAKQEAEAAVTAAVKPAPRPMHRSVAHWSKMAFTPDYIRSDEFVLPRRRVIVLYLDRSRYVVTAFLDNDVQLSIGLGNAKQAKAFMKGFTGECPPTCPHGTSAAGAAEAAAADGAAPSP
jgi:hypothetical protein